MIVTITISFLCSVMEAVLLSITPSFIASVKSENKVSAERMQRLKKQIDQPLAAILTLNTIAHTAGAAGVGAQAAVVFGDAAVGIASAIMTLLVLIFSEIIPKTLGANYWRQLSGVVCRVLPVMITVLKPFVWISDQLTKLFSSKKNEADFIRAEIDAMATLGSEHGVLGEDESTIITSLLRFRHTKLAAILTPRTVLFKVHKDLTVKAYLEQHGSEPFSRVPVYDEDADDIIGFVLKNDIMLAYHRLGPEYRIAKLVKSIHTVPETIELSNLFTTFLEKRLHICLVVDEYGDVQGIVTLEDLLECMLGMTILDERDRTSDMRQKAIKMWQDQMQQHDKLIDGDDQNDVEREPEKQTHETGNN